MKPASFPAQRPLTARLLAADAGGRLRHLPRASFPALLRRGDLVLANDAATLPASLSGFHAPSGETIEIRLAGRSTLAETRVFTALAFGSGDFHTRTEDRPAPPELKPGDRLKFGNLTAVVLRPLGHPRLVELRFSGSLAHIRAALARLGKPVQYAHVPVPLALWDVWTPIAGPPVAFEPPSAGFLLDWKMLADFAARGIGFATLTHAAGLSSTGDAALDARLPFDEPYVIPQATARRIAETKTRGGRIIAVGTTVVRALEDSAARSGGAVPPGEGLARLKLGPGHSLRVVDAVVSGTHERGTSHYELLRAFAEDDLLRRMDAELEAHGYLTHEFGDSVFLEHGKNLRPGGVKRLEHVEI
jgi:S-adenosylmethionine:tRNA ribosyltransferase-isomerase